MLWKPRAFSAREVRQRCADLGLSIDLYQPFRDFDSTDPAQVELNLRRADAKARAKELLEWFDLTEAADKMAKNPKLCDKAGDGG